MTPYDSSVPFSDELRALAKFIVDEFKGISNFAVVSILKEELLRVSSDSVVILSSVSLIMTYNLDIMKPKNPCQVLGWVWFSFLKKCIIKKLSFVKVHNEKVEFQKAECLVKTVKKCIMKKLSVWLALIKVAFWGVNDQKGQCIYKRIISYFFFFFLCEFVSYLNQLLHHT